MKTSDIPDHVILEAVKAYQQDRSGTIKTPDVALADKYPPKVILSKMQKMVDRGILDYGVSLRTAWIIYGSKS